MERPITEGESPVRKILRHPRVSPSTTGHVKPCGNLGGPSSKAKYYPVTDSEPVP
jgi:hypothetical protein